MKYPPKNTLFNPCSWAYSDEICKKYNLWKECFKSKNVADINQVVPEQAITIGIPTLGIEPRLLQP